VSQRWYNAAAARIAALIVLFGFAAFVEAAHQGSLKALANADAAQRLALDRILVAL